MRPASQLELWQQHKSKVVRAVVTHQAAQLVHVRARQLDLVEGVQIHLWGEGGMAGTVSCSLCGGIADAEA